MKYKYKITEQELEKAFGKLIQISDFDHYEDEQSEFKALSRGGQDYKEVYPVTITTPIQAQILLDYLSYDKSTWDYEPKLSINFFGTQYTFHRRGNMGHIHGLENGDMLIVDDWIRRTINESRIPGGLPQGDENLREGYICLLKANEAAEKKANDFAKQLVELRKEIEWLRKQGKEMPF